MIASVLFTVFLDDIFLVGAGVFVDDAERLLILDDNVEYTEVLGACVY